MQCQDADSFAASSHLCLRRSRPSFSALTAASTCCLPRTRPAPGMTSSPVSTSQIVDLLIGHSVSSDEITFSSNRRSTWRRHRRTALIRKSNDHMTAQSPLSLPDLLRQPWDKVRALQDRLLRETVKLAYHHHPFYSKLMRKAGLEPRHIQGCDDLVRLPTSSKADFLADPDAFRLDPQRLPPEQGTLWKIVYTTGTTSGRPAPIMSLHTITSDTCTLSATAGTDRAERHRPHRQSVSAYAVSDGSLCARTRRSRLDRRVGRIHQHRQCAKPVPVNRSLDDAVRAVERHQVTVLWGVAGFVGVVDARAGNRRELHLGTHGDDHR